MIIMQPTRKQACSFLCPRVDNLMGQKDKGLWNSPGRYRVILFTFISCTHTKLYGILLTIPDIAKDVTMDGKEIETYITRSANFRKQGERKIAFDVFYDLNKEKDESPMEFACRYGWRVYIYQMMAVDYLICNRDRHGANIEILVDEQGNARPAPFLIMVFLCFFLVMMIGKVLRILMC